MKRSSSGVGFTFAASVFGLALMLAVAMLLLLRYSSKWLRPHEVSTPTPLPPFADGIGLTPLLLILILLVLVALCVLLLVLALCVCKCGGKGFSFPRLPDLRGIAVILRGIATVLRENATNINTANSIVNVAREKLTGDVIDFKIWVPKFDSLGTITFGPFTGEVFIPAGGGWESPFNNDAKNALKAFINDATGKTALDGVSAVLRDKAVILETQADTLENQS